jgi:hypothetical protein
MTARGDQERDDVVIIATRFSRIAGIGRPDDTQPTRRQLVDETLCVLAESLSCLADVLRNGTSRPKDIERLVSLKRRLAALEVAICGSVEDGKLASRRPPPRPLR